MTTVNFEYKYEHMDRDWPNAKSLVRLRKIFDDNIDVYQRTLEALVPLEEHFDKIALEGSASELIPALGNADSVLSRDLTAKPKDRAQVHRSTFMGVGIIPHWNNIMRRFTPP